MKPGRLRCLALVALLLAPAGAALAHVVVHDDRGQALRFDAPPQRIVSLVPSVTESLCALGACARLVGVDRNASWPKEVLSLPKLGGLDDVPIERLVALRPDLVLAPPSSRAIERLEALGLKVVVLHSRNHQDVQRSLQLLGQLLGDPARASALWQAIEQQLQQAAARVPAALRGRSVYFEVESSPYAAGTSSFIGQTLQRLGLKNIVPEALGPFPKLSPEFVVRAQPDIVMAEASNHHEMTQRPGWNSLHALQRQQLCVFPGATYEVLVRPGPRLGEAALQLADLPGPVEAGRAVSARPMRSRRRLLLGLAGVSLLLLGAGLSAGSEGLSLMALRRLLDGPDAPLIIGQIRAPRTLGAWLTGGLLGLAGALAQGLFRNPLADPFLLGSASGASLGVVAVLAAGVSAGQGAGGMALASLARFGLVGAAFAGALGGVLLTLLLARGAQHTVRLLLAGVVVGVVAAALGDLLTLLVPEALRGRQAFMLGSTTHLGWHGCALLGLGLVLALPLAMRLSRVLDALVLGEDSARSLGLALPLWRLLLVCLLAAATGLAVSQTGLVAFVGLAAPHLVRRMAPGAACLSAAGQCRGRRGAAAGRRRGRARADRTAGVAGGSADRRVRRRLFAQTVAAPDSGMNTSALASEDLHVSLGDVPVLQGVSLQLRPGWTAIVGPNGAGKSTLLRALAGLVPAGQGQVLLQGRPLGDWSLRQRAQRVAWLAQQGHTHGELTVRDVVQLGRLPYLGLFGSPGPDDRRCVEEAMRATECRAWQDRRLDQLSGGERQRCLLARALAVNAPVLLLDEPTTHLDPAHQVAVVRLLQRLAPQHTVVSVLHDLPLALQADRLVVMRQGTVVAQGAHDDPALHEALRAVFEHAIAVRRAGPRFTAFPDLE